MDIKKMLSLLTSLIFIVCLTACGSKEDSNPLDSAIKDAIGTSVYEINTTNDYITVEYTLNKTPLNYSDYVSQGLTHCIKAAKYIFENTEYTQLQITMKEKETENVITSFIISKDGYNMRNWTDIVFTKGIYDEIQDSFIKFHVESTLMNGVDTNEVMIKDYLKD